MQTGCFLLFVYFPVILEGCCVTTPHQKTTGIQQDQRYRVVEGDIFMMPCNESDKSMTAWNRTEDDNKGKEILSFICKTKFAAEVKHSGIYKSLTGSSLTLQVENNSCAQPNESSLMLRAYAGGTITCPGLSCSNNTDVVWYKENKNMYKWRRRYCEKMGLLQLCEVDEKDTAIFFCDRKVIKKGVTWTLRRAVNVTVVPHFKASDRPEITYPLADVIEEVELGQPHNLKCKVYFDYEVNSSRKVQWFMSYGGNMANMTSLNTENETRETREYFKKYEVIHRAIIKEVTTQHLNHTYTCIASNTVGISSITIRLKQKMQVKWPSLVGYPVACFLLVAGLGIILHVKWLEIQLICRSHFQFENYNREEKDFDVFLSYVWSPLSPEVTGGLTFSTSGLYNGAEDMQNTAETKVTQRPIEVLLPQMLENQWGYRLYLLARDLIPGGAYTNDVVLAIKRSRMLICVLSAEYLADSSAVFVLESGVKALLQKSSLKLLLIWNSRTSTSLIQPDPPLPKLVQRALKVLPSLDWSSNKSSTATSRFWTSLKKEMPNNQVRLVSHMQC